MMMLPGRIGNLMVIWTLSPDYHNLVRKLLVLFLVVREALDLLWTGILRTWSSLLIYLRLRLNFSPSKVGLARHSSRQHRIPTSQFARCLILITPVIVVGPMVLVAQKLRGLTPSHWHTNGRNFLQLLGYFWRQVVLAPIDPGQPDSDSPYNTWVSSPQWLKHFQ